MGGGSWINRNREEPVAVVDLQKLALNQIESRGSHLHIGAGVTLREIVEAEQIPAAVRNAARLEANYNLSQVSTLAGSLVSGRSPLAAILSALDSTLVWQPGEVEISLGEWLPQRSLQGAPKPGGLITRVILPNNARAVYHQIGRTPRDWPLVCVAAAAWPSGRKRLVVGGFGPAPLLALDGTGVEGFGAAARNVMQDAGDEWASAEYRREMAGILAGRCASEVEGQ
jgi:CO/xanthine dehydrogenase FAD-binding subunit